MTVAPLHGSAFLVTGGSGSVGRATCARLLRDGARVAVHGRHAATAAATCDALAADLGVDRPVSLDADLSMPGAADRLVAAARDALGRLDGVINCAVQAPPGVTGVFADTDPAGYTPLLHDSVTQVQWLLRAAMPAFAGAGAFVTIVSDAALFAARDQALIAASRAAVVAFCRNAALELAQDGVRVNCVSTSFVAGSRIARDLAARGSVRLARAAQRAGLGLPDADDVANLCVFLVGPGAARLTGQVISVNGGLNA